MFPAPGRRAFLQSLLGGVVGGAVLGRAAFADGAPVVATRLSETLALMTGAGGNVLAATSADGLLLVNGGSRERSADLLAEIGRQFGGKRVQTLFNTDWHPDHSGANELLRKAGATIVAHEYTKQYQSTPRTVEWQHRVVQPLTKQALPTRTFYTSDAMTFGGEKVEYGQLGQAHTDGDIYVFFPGQNVLVAGDVLSVGAYPIADYTTGGWLGGMVTATKTLLDMSNADTRVVPGSGPLQTRADLEAQHQMLLTLRDRIGTMMRQGMGAEDMLAAGVTKDYDAKWGDPRLFVTTSYKGMWFHVRELGGVV
jgi:glyoxylase-like metal-dependent hydrolase (beta-lactamase superfamily II)